MTYTTVVFDFDHTLFDTTEAERLSFAHSFNHFGVHDSDRYYGDYHRINQGLWRRVEAGELTPADVAEIRFPTMIEELGLEIDPVSLGERFVVGMGDHGSLFEGALDLLEDLASDTRLAILTNALASVQRARLVRLGLERFFDVIVISSEVGSAKPAPEIFEVLFEQLGHPDVGETLMVGDSLPSDIAGANGYGMPSCWYNPHGQPAGDGHQITHEIASFAELPAIVRGTSPLR